MRRFLFLGKRAPLSLELTCREGDDKDKDNIFKIYVMMMKMVVVVMMMILLVSQGLT